MGMTLAFGVRLLAHKETTRALGILYAANTFGACVAPLIAEYQLIGALGLVGLVHVTLPIAYLGVWMVLGIVIYVAYGRRHSVLANSLRRV